MSVTILAAAIGCFRLELVEAPPEAVEVSPTASVVGWVCVTGCTDVDWEPAAVFDREPRFSKSN